jgi:hypothetical protein
MLPACAVFILETASPQDAGQPISISTLDSAISIFSNINIHP